MIALPFMRNNSLKLQGIKVYIREPYLSDYQEWKVLREKSRAFLTPWEPTWAQDALEKSAFRQRIRYYQEEINKGTTYPFFLFRNEDQRLVGGISLNNIRRGVGQNAMIGYWSGAPYAGKGYMSEALALVIPFAFQHLGLHRLEAACIPHNIRSISLLEKAGFQKEGHLRSYLKINGVWQDHILLSLLESDKYKIDNKV
ncbi:GNAT family N-acetyltransferase [Paenochrobactrum sp. BZR 588]|uniref:GNAT family N-acetyltransferase n=1 Tax=Paenochrobactrum TaxID=999488 RepID=UPI0035BBA84B